MRFHLDHNATTPVDPRVLERYVAVERVAPGNPSSLHAAGRAARAILEDARREVAAALGVAADDVVFVSGGTEANNAVIAGCGDVSRPVLCGAGEHRSVLEPAARRGVRALPLDRWGRIRFDAVVADPGDPPGLVSVAHAQSELGTLQDLAAARALADRVGAPLHVDAAQTLGRVPIAAAVAVADALVLSVHKCGGLRGASALVVRGGALRPLLLGGGQERGLRAGTPSPALAAATALAVRLAVDEQADRAARMAAARDAFVATIRTRSPRTAVLTPLGAPGLALPNTAMLGLPVPDGRALLIALDLAGVEASQGSACSAGAPEPPAVLAAIGLDDAAARRSVRFSFGHCAAPVEGVAAAETVLAVLARMSGDRLPAG